MTAPTPETAAILAGQASPSNKSTATEAQLDRLLILLRLRPHHTHELRSKGISHPAGRVLNLIERGCVIDSDRITSVDSDGFQHVGVALYTLVSEPVEVQHGH